MLVNKFPSWDISGLSLSFWLCFISKNVSLYHFALSRDWCAFGRCNNLLRSKILIFPNPVIHFCSKVISVSVDTLFHIWFASKLNFYFQTLVYCVLSKFLRPQLKLNLAKFSFMYVLLVILYFPLKNQKSAFSLNGCFL